jgi:hypothetical protein
MVEMFVERVRRMRAEAEGGAVCFCWRCALCDDEGVDGGSDMCDAESLVCSHERGRREMLGKQFSWPGDGSFCFVLICGFERLLIRANSLLLLTTLLYADWR